ncbi:MAG: polysaccharide deacetylase family protein [Clostridia bacterium]|nr:polysaccharide deacetylase family protein [Clostridia bacterium]
MGVYMVFPKGKRKALTLSYDDGIRQDRRLVEILDRYAIKGTFNVNCGSMNEEVDFEAKTGKMSKEEIKALFENSAHELAIHGYTHEFDNLLPNNIMVNEIIEDRKALEKLTGKIIRGMAYPFGTYNDKLVDCLKACGIVYSRTVISSHSFKIPTDWLRLEATCHHSDKELMNLCDSFLEGKPTFPQVFYLWGHSFEFDRNVENNNWGIIEKFAEKMGNRDDIWYATNIEIYDYVKAYEALDFSTDESLVHNPTATDVYIICSRTPDSPVVEVKAGQTVRLKD